MPASRSRAVLPRLHTLMSPAVVSCRVLVFQVITWIHEQGEKLFPIGVEFEGLITTQKALQTTLHEFEEAATVFIAVLMLKPVIFLK